MTNRNNLLWAFSAITMLLICSACGQTDSTKNSAPAHQISTNDVILADDSSSSSSSSEEGVNANDLVLTLDTFSTFPPEIDGCACYFCNDSLEFEKRLYIYANDYAQTSFLKINGVMTKFVQIDFKELSTTTTIAKAISDQYEMTIECIDGIQSGDETWINTGTIKLTDKKGRTLTKTFYGECGC
jgi:hypothetical protein